MYAANGSESANAGSTTCWRSPQPPMGNRGNFTAKRIRRIAPITKVGSEIPTTASTWVPASSGVLGFKPPITPAMRPSTSAIRIAERPKATETGSPAARISFTDQSE